MATLEKAEELEQRLMINSGEQGAQALMRLSGALSKKFLAGAWKGGKYVWNQTNERTNALADMFADAADGMRERAHEKKWGSEVTVKEFSDTVEGKREIVDLDDDELVGEVRQELRKHGVTFAVERDDEGQHYLHVRGNDASLIAHALDRAQERLDDRRLNQEITELGQAAAWVEKQEAPANEKRAELRNSADYLKATPEEQAEMSTQLENTLATEAQQRIDTNSRGQVPPKVLEAEEQGLRGMDVAVELRQQAQTLAREGTPRRGAEREAPQQETAPERDAPQREETSPEQPQSEDRAAPTADDLDAHEEAHLDERRQGLEHKGADLPEGYATPAAQDVAADLDPIQQEKAERLADLKEWTQKNHPDLYSKATLAEAKGEKNPWGEGTFPNPEKKYDDAVRGMQGYSLEEAKSILQDPHQRTIQDPRAMIGFDLELDNQILEKMPKCMSGWQADDIADRTQMAGTSGMLGEPDERNMRVDRVTDSQTPKRLEISRERFAEENARRQELTELRTQQPERTTPAPTQETSLPEGYEGQSAPAQSQTAPASDRAARAPERSPSPRREDKNDRGGRGPGTPAKDRPKLADRREESKANLREKIGKLSDRLKQGTGTGALTHERGLGAHKKGPTR